MDVKVFLIVIIVGIIDVGATQAPSSDCNVIHYNFYGHESPDQQQGSPGRPPDVPPAVGPPGKSGARGLPGPPGQKGDVGQKGARGENLEENQRFRELEEKVQQLEQFKRSILRPAISCAHIGGSEADSGVYFINPAQNVGGSIQVFCNFSSGSATTMIGHDQEAETEVTCEDPQCHRRDVTYEATDQQIRALIEVSGTCRQFIKYRCKGSALVYSESSPFAAWISARGTKKYNWDGSVGDYYCACGGTGTCLHSSQLSPPRCNCDNNGESSWTSDEGYLTSKPDLPVKALLFGDTGGSGEEGFHTLGKLECSGRA